MPPTPRNPEPVRPSAAPGTGDPMDHLDHLLNYGLSTGQAIPSPAHADASYTIAFGPTDIPGPDGQPVPNAVGWNATEATRLAKTRGTPDTVNVSVWYEEMFQTGKVHIDPEYARTITPARLQEPVVLLRIPGDYRFPAVQVGGKLVIDGNHRLYRAWQLGVAQLPAVIVHPDDERAVRLPDEVLRIAAFTPLGQTAEIPDFMRRLA